MTHGNFEQAQIELVRFVVKVVQPVGHAGRVIEIRRVVTVDRPAEINRTDRPGRRSAPLRSWSGCGLAWSRAGILPPGRQCWQRHRQAAQKTDQMFAQSVSLLSQLASSHNRESL